MLLLMLLCLTAPSFPLGLGYAKTNVLNMMVGVKMRSVARKVFYARKLDRGSSGGGEIRWADPYNGIFSSYTIFLFFTSEFFGMGDMPVDGRRLIPDTRVGPPVGALDSVLIYCVC